jgi:hypothetical protein
MPSPGDIRRARRRAVGGKRDRCRRGKPCSAACVARWKYCLAEMPAPVQGAIPRAINAIKDRKVKVKPSVRQEKIKRVRNKLGENALSANIKYRDLLIKKLNKLAITGDRPSYQREEKRLLKLEAKITEKFGSPGGINPHVSEQIWNKTSEKREALQRRIVKKAGDIHHGMIKAALNRDRNEYNKLESKFFKLEEFRGRKPWKEGSLWTDIRRKEDKLRYRKISEKLQEMMAKAATKKDKNRYDALENRLMKIKEASGENYSKGSLWDRIRIQERAEKFKKISDKLYNLALEAAKKRNRYEYNRIEKKLIDLEKRELGFNRAQSGVIWARVRYPQLQRVEKKINKKLRSLALNNDKEGYKKLEEKLFRLYERYGSNISRRNKGEIWSEVQLDIRSNRYEKIRDKILEEVRKNALSGDRDGYEASEKKLLSLVKASSKFGDYDIQNYSKGDIWNTLNNSEMAAKLQRAIGFKSSIVQDSYSDSISIITRIDGQKLTLSIGNGTFAFSVNDNYSTDTGIPMRTRVKLLEEVKRQFGEVVKNLKNGEEIETGAWQDDGRGQKREKAYEAFGFSPPKFPGGEMYGRVEDGKIVPSDVDSYIRYRRHQR